LIPMAIDDCTLTTRRFDIQRTTTKRADWAYRCAARAVPCARTNT
jgi:hypothetical protein